MQLKKQIQQLKSNAAQIQKALGYRYVIDEAHFNSATDADKTFDVSFTVKNTGSAPLYYNLPIEISLLDKNTKEVVWKSNFQNTDTTAWLPDEEYKKDILYSVSGSFTANVPDGEYVIAVSLTQNGKPCVRFANTNYITGGRTPLGIIGINTVPQNNLLDDTYYDDLFEDKTLFT